MLKFRLAIILPTLASIVIGYIWYMKKKQRNGEPSWPSNEESQKADEDLISDDDVSEASNVNDDNNIPLECNPSNLVRELINSTASNPNGVGNEIGNDVNADEIINDDDDDDGVNNGGDIIESHFQSPLSINHHDDDNSKHESNDNAENKIGETIEQEDDSEVMQIISEENRNNHIEPLLETEEQHIHTETITLANTQTDMQSITEVLQTTRESMSNTNSNDMHADTHVRHVQKTSLCNVETDDVSTISANTHGVETNTHGVETNTHGVETNIHGVETNTNGVETNTHSIETNTHGVETNTHSIETNTHGVETNTHGVETNTHSIETNTHGVETNTHGVETNTHDVEMNTHDVETNTHDVETSTHSVETNMESIVDSNIKTSDDDAKIFLLNDGTEYEKNDDEVLSSASEVFLTVESKVGNDGDDGAVDGAGGLTKGDVCVYEEGSGDAEVFVEKLDDKFELVKDDDDGLTRKIEEDDTKLMPNEEDDDIVTNIVGSHGQQQQQLLQAEVSQIQQPPPEQQLQQAALQAQCEQSYHPIKQQHEHSESVVEGEELHQPQHRLDQQQQHQSTEHHHLWSDIIDEDSTISPIETYFNNADNNNNTDTTSTLTPLWQSNCPPNDYATAATTTTTNAKSNKESVRRTRSSRHRNKNKNNTINNNDSCNDRRSKSKPDDVAKSAADDSNNQHGGRDHHHHHHHHTRHQEDDKYIHFRKNRPSSGSGNDRKKFAGSDGFNDFNWRSTNKKPAVDQSSSGFLRGCDDENANSYRDGLAAEASHTGNANMNSDENLRNGDEVFAEEGLDHQIRTTSESDGMPLSTSEASSSATAAVTEAATAAVTEAATAVCEDTSIETYKFEFPGDLCGLLIGRKGRTVNAIGRESNTSIFVDRRSESASASDKQIVIINGTKKCIKMALKLLKERFPPKKFPEINFDVCIVDDPLPASASPMFFTSDSFQQLELPSSEMFPGVVANIVSAHHLFIHLPFHQSFQLLPMLSSYIYSCYSRLAGSSMNLPHPIMPYTFCICGINGGWYRSLVTQVVSNRKDGASYNNNEDGDGGDDDLTYIVRFVDYGGYEQVKASDLFLIRNDFMDLPFQAIECYLANVCPPLGMNGYPEESARRLEELTRDVQLCVSVVGVADNGVPCIQLFKSVDDMMLLDVAQDLLELNLISICPPQPRNIISLAEITALSATSTTNTTTTSSTHLPHSNDVVFNDFAPSNAVGMGLATNAVGMYNSGVVGVSDDRYIDEAIRQANMVYDMVGMADDDGAADHRSSQ